MKTQPPKYDKVSKDRARYARNLADLLLRKASQTMTPQEMELVLQCMRIHDMTVVVVPEYEERVNYTFEHIATATEEAEALLVGCPPMTEPLHWEKFQALLKDENDAERLSA